MAHFAQIDENNTVLRVIVVADEHEADGENWCNNFIGGRWKQTSYNTSANTHSMGKSPLRKNYAGVGFYYDTQLDAFIPPKPYDSWLLDEDTCHWEAPVPYPEDADPTQGILYMWDEDNIQWVLEEPPELET
jgi:hypothetical protein